MREELRTPDRNEGRIAANVLERTAGLYVRDVGRGPAVLLLHAFPLNGRMWQPQLDGLADRARLLAPDLPGFGLSPNASTQPSLDDYAQQIVRLLDLLRVDDVIVVGLSMGGYVAFRIVDRYPERVRGLVLADTRPTGDAEKAATERHRLAAEIEADGVEVAAAEFLPKLLGATTVRSRPTLVDVVHEIVRENTAGGLAFALRAMAARPNSTALLSTIRCPALCIVGEEDSITPPHVVRTMAEQLPAGTFCTIGAAGHLTNLEAPDAFNDALAEFVSVAAARSPSRSHASRP
jgi:pimeloyl-ACP methyl ester carboxylesterase